MYTRRFVAGIAAPRPAASMGAGKAHPPINPERRFWARRRTRRYASTQIVSGRQFWVVPAGLAAGWELVYRNRVLVVRETCIVERNGRMSEVAVVEDSSGHRYTVDITREDNAENSQELEGTIVEEPMPCAGRDCERATRS